MTRIIAPIDEKNVTTDWIGEVFDEADYTQDGKSMMGFVSHFPLLVAWSDNNIVWQAVLGGDSCLNEVEKRLAEYEDSESGLYSVRKRIGNLIVQSFYFRED